MSCVDIMYQPYSTGFPYQRPSTEASSVQAFDVLPRMHEPLDLGSTSFTSSSSSSAPAAAVVSSSVKEEVEKEGLTPRETHYLNANCVLLTYFSGDTSSVVDEHFSRALSQPSSYSSDTQPSKPLLPKDGPLMSQRNFPASFWNSAYQSPHIQHHHDFQLSSNPYFSSSALHSLPSLHQTHDSWHYPLSSHTSHASSYHRPMHYDLPYPSMATTSRFSPSYSSLLMNPSMRTSQFPTMTSTCDLGKTAEATRPRYPDPRLATDFPSHTALPGLEGSLQEAGKDLYWF